jgi:hypothetical protein
MTTIKTKREQHTIDKNRSRKVFKAKPVDMSKLKSCIIDKFTTILISKRESKKKAREKFLMYHQHYNEIYNERLGGRVKKQK